MKYSYQSVVTPSKLINPFHASAKPKQYKPIKTYLELSKVTPRHMKNRLLENGVLNEEELSKVTIRDFPLFSFRDQGGYKKKKLNRSCKIKKTIESSPRAKKDNSRFEIPGIRYKEFEPFHLPSVKVKVKLETYRPKPFWVTMKEEIEDSVLSASVQSPSRIEIAEHSREYFTRLERVTEIAKQMKSEFMIL